MKLIKNAEYSVSRPVMTDDGRVKFDAIRCTHYLIVYGSNKKREELQQDEWPDSRMSNLDDKTLLEDGVMNVLPFKAMFVNNNRYIMEGKAVSLEENVTWAAVFGCTVEDGEIRCAVRDDPEESECFRRIPIRFYMNKLGEKKSLFSLFTKKKETPGFYRLMVEQNGICCDGEIEAVFRSGGEEIVRPIGREELGHEIEIAVDAGAPEPKLRLTDGCETESLSPKKDGTIVSVSSVAELVRVSEENE